MPFPINRPWIPNITGRLNPANVIVQTHTLPPSVSPQTFGYEELSPAWLENKFRSRYGADLLAFCVGADTVPGAADALLVLPNRAGAALTGTAAFRGNKSINGRAAWEADAATSGHLQATMSATIKSTWTVLTSPALPFATGFACALGCNVADPGSQSQLVTGYSGASVLFTDGPTVKIDGVSSADVASGTHVYETTGASITATVLRVGYIATSLWTWRAPQGIVIAIGRASTAGEAADSLLDLKRYFRL